MINFKNSVCVGAWALIFTFAALICSLAFAFEPPNLTRVKYDIALYHDEGRYLKDVAGVIARAKAKLAEKIQANKTLAHPQKLALVFDIDETSLSNYDDMKNRDFGGRKEDYIHSELLAKDPAINPTLALYRYARENKVAVFFVTGRRLPIKEATIKNLHLAGYDHWQGLILKPEDYHQKSAIPFKVHARETIEKQGFEIVETIGDQWSDLLGGHADYVFKLPNPFYYLP